MAGSDIPCTQINLHHSKGASAVLTRRMQGMRTGISLIQEPWVYRERISGLGDCGNLYKCPLEKAPRACITVKGMDALLVPKLCTRDLVVIKMRLKGKTGERLEVYIASAYFPGNATTGPPPREVEGLVQHCHNSGIPLLLGCDANTHHVMWGSTDTNDRGRDLLEFIAGTDLEILNRGNKPTFHTKNREEVLDVTLCSGGLVDKVRGWRVSEEESLSDHRHLVYWLTLRKPEVKLIRNPKRTDWGAYSDELRGRLEGFPSRYGTIDELEHAADFLQRAIITSFENNCPTTEVGTGGGKPWWNSHLQVLRSRARKRYNKAYKTKKESDKALYKEAQKEYNKMIQRCKKEGWSNFCETSNTIPKTARLHRILAKNPEARLGPIMLATGELAENEEDCLNRLLEVHFPGVQIIPNEQVDIYQTDPRRGADWKIAAEIVSVKRVEWAVGTFQPCKSPGADGVYPVLLQEGLGELRMPMTKIFRASIALGHVPMAWRGSRVVFLPKPGREGYSNAKDFRPVSLTSFILKALEKLVERYIRDRVLSIRPLHSGQHAFQAGCSVDTALHEAVGRIERQLEEGGYVVGTFLDIEGAFSNTPPEVICREAQRCGVPRQIVVWIRSMLQYRRLSTEWGGCRVGGVASMGCPQGGVLSPILWCLTVDGLLRSLNEEGYYTQGYADDFVILNRGIHLEPLLGLTRSALCIVERWCIDSGLTVNPEKTEMVVFTRKYKVAVVEGPLFCGKRLQAAQSVKYLGVILDKKLNWAEHLEAQCRRFTVTFWLCRRAFGRTWGLGPRMIAWLYSAILKPRLLYAAVVWWPRVELKTVQAKLGRLQTLLFRGLTGALRTTPTAAMGLMICEEPLHLAITAEAARTFVRLATAGKWKEGPRHTRLPMDILSLPTLKMRQDRIIKRHSFDKLFQTCIPEREAWVKEKGGSFLQGDIWYTDGSKWKEGTGAGLYDRAGRRGLAIPLGQYPTVFQAEVFAILHCAETLISEGKRDRCISICSDSQAAIKAVGKIEILSLLVWECKEALNQLARTNKVTLIWVPGHTGIKGNEKADQLAKRGATEKPIGPEPVLSLAPCCTKLEIKTWVVQQHNKYWAQIKGCRQAKAILGDHRRTDLARAILSWPKDTVRLMVQMLTGHNHLNYHKYRMGLVDSTACRKCDRDDESSLHVLGNCPALAGIRLQTLGSAELEPEEIRDLPANDILTFLKKAGMRG